MVYNTTWGTPGSRRFSAGVDRGMLFIKHSTLGYQTGLPWNGLVSVKAKTKTSGREARYIDGSKYYLSPGSSEQDFTIEAYTYPPEFEICMGVVEYGMGFSLTDQNRVAFGFSYRTLLGDDLRGENLGYLLHLVYNAYLGDSDSSADSLSDSVNVETFSFPIETIPEHHPQTLPSAHIIVNSLRADPTKLGLVESILYGEGLNNARLPSLAELFDIFGDDFVFSVSLRGPGVWEASGPEEMLVELLPGVFAMETPTLIEDDGDFSVTDS